MTGLRVCTVGHSTHPIEEFLQMLWAHDIELIVDVRTVPGSRHNPQFGERELRDSLQRAGFRYERLAGLGGLRHTRAGTHSINMAWRNRSFRDYADYMQTDQFAEAVAELLTLAATANVAIMCAEAVPWRCHRSLIGDALLARGVQVLDIMSRTSVHPHTMTSFAVIDGERVWYPAELDG